MTGLGQIALGSAPIFGGALLAVAAGQFKGPNYRDQITKDMDLLDRLPTDERIAFALEAAEVAKFLEDHGPRNHGEDQEKQENSTSDPSGLFENAADVGHEERGEQKNG